MSSIIAGIFCFVLIACAEWATYKKIRLFKPVLWLAIFPLALYALVTAWLDGPNFNFPTIVTILAWIPFILFFGLFIYSLFIEIPLNTYMSRSQPLKVVSTGTYSLDRHPAFLWYIGWHISAVFVSQSVTLAAATPFWIGAYLACILFEDKLFSKSDFSEEYMRYKEKTPMIIPTRRSLLCFWSNIRRSE